MKKTLHLFLFLSCIATPWQIASASHIVGGEMSYICLGNDQYQITLKVFRDCFNGQAAYDSYTMVYQRCCRNMIIFNIVAPDNTGASYVATIPSDTLAVCNSSPYF